MASVAVADAVFPAGSETVKAKVELSLKPLSAGLNFRPVNWVTLKVSPIVTGVMPSARSTVPSDGSAVTVAVKAEEAKLESIGAAIPIVVARLFSATVSEAELSFRGLLIGALPLLKDRDITSKAASSRSMRQRPNAAESGSRYVLACKENQSELFHDARRLARADPRRIA
jgi:hypothetical protein